MAYKVIAECVDSRTGKRYFAGDVFKPDPDADQAARLIKAGCLEEVKGKAAKAPTDGLSELDLDALRALADKSGLAYEADASADMLIGLLREKGVKAGEPA